MGACEGMELEYGEWLKRLKFLRLHEKLTSRPPASGNEPRHRALHQDET